MSQIKHNQFQGEYHALPYWSEIAERIDQGILFRIFYDTETSDLNKRFAEINQFGGWVFDLAYNPLHDVNYRARFSPYTVISPYAWATQRLRLDDLDKGDPRYLFMGKVMQFFRQSGDLMNAPFRERFLSQCQMDHETHPTKGVELFYRYPVLDEDGQVDMDRVRITENLKRLFYKDSLGNWHRRDIKAMSVGYNNVNADDQWLWSNAHMAGAENVFMTHLAQNGKVRLDALRLIEAAFLAGDGGENGIRALTKIDPDTGAPYFSFSMGDILSANTHIASEVRDFLEGVTLPDGSYVDLTQLHGAHADAFALAGLLRYAEQRERNVTLQMERNTNWKHVDQMLAQKEGNFGLPPILSYVDKTYPSLDGKMVTLLGTDRYRHNPKIALVYNLSIDPDSFRFHGKRLAELDKYEWKAIIQNARTNPNGIVKVIKMHHSPRLLSAETGYAAGFNLGMDRIELARRQRAIHKLEITEQALQGMRLAYPRLDGPEHMMLPQEEEELFAFSTLEKFDPEAGENVQIHSFRTREEKMAHDARYHAMTVKSLWMKAVEPDEDAILKEKPDADDFAAMTDKITALNKKLKRENGPEIPRPDGKLETREQALAYQMKIVFFARSHFFSGALKDVGHHYWFEDKKGLHISDADLSKWPDWKVDEAYRSGNLNICFETLNTSVRILDRILEEMGYGEALGPQVLAQLDALKALRVNGIPHNHGLDERWYTASQAQKDLTKIEQNEIMDEDRRALEGMKPGAWQKFMSVHHDAPASLEEYRRYITDLKARTLALKDYPLVDLDPRNGYEIANALYEIDQEKQIIIDVPDRYLEAPLRDPITNQPSFILPLSKSFNAATHLNDKDVILRARETGKLYHFPKAYTAHAPQEGGIYQEFYTNARALYASSGGKKLLPAPDRRVALVGEGPYPVHELRGLNDNAQSLRVAKTDFEALLSPELASSIVAPKGLMFRDDSLSLQEGPVRLMEIDESSDDATGWEVDTDILHARKIGWRELTQMHTSELTQYGFATRDAALDHFAAAFAKLNDDPRAPKNQMWLVRLGPIDPRAPQTGMHFYNPRIPVISRLRIDFDAMAGFIAEGLSPHDALNKLRFG